MNIKRDVNLAGMTTIKLGGPAKYFLEVKSSDGLREALRWAKDEEVRIHVLGGGSNTIFQDKGFDGLVIKMGLRGMEFEGELVTAAAGENWDSLVEEAVGRGWAGVECLSGIPGLVGATPMQNVGAYGQEVAQTIVAVKALNRETLEERVFTNKECDFKYRSSRFKHEDIDKYVIAEVVYKLEKDGKPNLSYPQVREVVKDGVSLLEVREVVLGLRRKKSMVIDESDINSRSCGSFFVNPPHPGPLLGKGEGENIPTFVDSDSGEERIPAAWLIEQVGFSKGYREGGEGISQNHNLALINIDGTSRELMALADKIKAAVKEKFGIDLAREPVLVD